MSLFTAACERDPVPDNHVTSTTSTPTTTNFGTRMANSLLSWCILHEPRSYVRTQLEGMVAPDKVDVFLDQYDRLVGTGGCG